MNSTDSERAPAAAPVVHSLVNALRAVPDFATLNDDALLQIVGASANLFWAADSVVFEKAAPAEALYVVLSGAVRIVDIVDGREDEVATIGPGDFFGEHALLTYTTHSKSAQAVEDSEFMVIPKESFQALLGSHAELAAHFREKLETRLVERATGAGAPRPRPPQPGAS